jgi:hypothetical protein
MSWAFLSFLGEPWFVITWYAIGAIGVWFLVYDLHDNNTVLKPAMKWGWPIIVFFFSVIGLALYFLTARAPGIGNIKDEKEKERLHTRYEMNMWRRVNGAVIHCVAGDGAGIMTGMVIARAAGMSFWQEFWFEYLVGFAFGWFIFQRKSMTMMTDSIPMQLAMAFRAEFFSMLTVMGGMGAVMAYITPMVATQQPKPLTAAFWGFGMLGLLVGYVFTFPMNWLIVKVGWKHGMGGMEGGERMQIENPSYRLAAIATMIVLGLVAEVIPAWLFFVRERAPLRYEGTAAVSPAPDASTGEALQAGLAASIDEAIAALANGERTRAALAIDGAYRVGKVGAHSAPCSFYSAYEQIQNAKLALEQGHEGATVEHLEEAARTITHPADVTAPFLDPSRYAGATVIDQRGTIIGEVARVSGDTVDIVLGGWRDAWGFLDFGGGRQIRVTAGALAYTAPQQVGATMVALPTTIASVEPRAAVGTSGRTTK